MKTLPTIEKVIAAGTAKLIADPSRIVRAVYADHMLPPTGKLLTEMLSDCSRLLRAQTVKGRAGHWSYDLNRQIALEQAQDALLALIVGADPLPLSNAA